MGGELSKDTTSPVASALGRLEPSGGIVHVAAPYSVQGPAILLDLLVAEGQFVTNSQPLARTHTFPAMKAAWRHAQQLVESARARLHQAEAGAKSAELAALTAEAERDRADLVDARRELERQRRLRAEGVSAQQTFDDAHTRVLTRSNAVEAATQRLNAGSEIRAVDVEVARREVDVAQAMSERAREELEQTVIRAPQAGQILVIHSRVGEQVGPEGLLDLGQTEQMDVRAEVYETDIRHLRLGQRAEVTGEAFEGTLSGRVHQIARRVRPNRLLKLDPSAFADARVIEVIVRLENAQFTTNLSGALVNARFLP